MGAPGLQMGAVSGLRNCLKLTRAWPVFGEGRGGSGKVHETKQIRVKFGRADSEKSRLVQASPSKNLNRFSGWRSLAAATGMGRMGIMGRMGGAQMGLNPG